MAFTPKVSIIICVYQNAQGITDVIDSITKQDYFNIEVIIADDCSDYFPEEEIKEYIEQDKSVHIKDYSIIRNDENVGTVLNLKRALERMTGDYYITMGGDDLLASENIISSFVDYFNSNPDKKWVCSKEIHISEEDRRILEIVPSEYDKEILLSGDINANWNIWARKGVLSSAAVCYSSRVLEEIEYDLSYKYIEDWPFFCKLLKRGYAPGYIDVPAFYHSRGGISDVNISEEKREFKRQFILEKQRIFWNEVDSFRCRFTFDSKRKYKFYCQEFITKPLFLDYEYNDLPRIRKIFVSPKRKFWLLEKQYWGDRARYNRNIFRIREFFVFFFFVVSIFLFQMNIMGRSLVFDAIYFLLMLLVMLLRRRMPAMIEKHINAKVRKRYRVTHE